MSKGKRPQIVNPDEYIICRGIPVPKLFIDQKQQEFGARLIPDTAPDLQEALDQQLRRFRTQAVLLGKNIHPKDYMFEGAVEGHKGYFFYSEIPIPAGIYMAGLPSFITNAIHKPIWFYAAKLTRGGRPSDNGKSHKW